MWIPFQEMPDSSRVWIFQGDQSLDQQQESQLDSMIKTFIEDWTSHQSVVQASYIIRHRRFIIIAVDEAQVGPSGCSIDKLFRFVQSMESMLGFSLLNKNKIAIMKENEVITYTLAALKSKVKNGEITLVEKYFDLMVNDKYTLSRDWIKPISSGWLAKHCLN